MKTLKTGIVSLLLLSSVTLGTATHTHRLIQPAKLQDIECLARNIYHEARGESLQGQIAVAQVTLNRVESGSFQNSVCKTVYARKQFSWTNSGTKKVKDTKAWKDSVAVATAVLTKSVHLPDFKALYFHTKQVKPSWNRDKRVLAVIGNHIFYA
jgi:spore germination cell wall hydrolase CwlJ-like protein